MPDGWRFAGRGACPPHSRSVPRTSAAGKRQTLASSPAIGRATASRYSEQTGLHRAWDEALAFSLLAGHPAIAGWSESELPQPCRADSGVVDNDDFAHECAPGKGP